MASYSNLPSLFPRYRYIYFFYDCLNVRCGYFACVRFTTPFCCLGTPSCFFGGLKVEDPRVKCLHAQVSDYLCRGDEVGLMSVSSLQMPLFPRAVFFAHCLAISLSMIL